MAEAAQIADLAASIVQKIIDYWGAVKITSGHRSPAVNKAVKGSPTSQHCRGEAADFKPLEADIDLVFKWIVKESGIKFGQAILEKVGGAAWIHISLPRKDKPNQQALTYDGKAYKFYC